MVPSDRTKGLTTPSPTTSFGKTGISPGEQWGCPREQWGPAGPLLSGHVPVAARGWGGGWDTPMVGGSLRRSLLAGPKGFRSTQATRTRGGGDFFCPSPSP